MAFRVSVKNLESVCKLINVALGKPTTYSDDSSPTFKANIGYHHIYADQCGYRLHITCNEGGGVHSKFGSSTKAELFGKLHAYLDGLYSREGVLND